MNFEDYDYEAYTNPQKLNDYIKEKINDDEKYYIFLDELIYLVDYIDKYKLINYILENFDDINVYIKINILNFTLLLIR